MINDGIANGPALDLSVREDQRLDLSLVRLESASLSGLAFGAAVVGPPTSIVLT